MSLYDVSLNGILVTCSDVEERFGSQVVMLNRLKWKIVELNTMVFGNMFQSIVPVNFKINIAGIEAFMSFNNILYR